MKYRTRHTHLLLALDFDGTLAALRRDPAHARLSASRRALLERLGSQPGIRVLIVSGRPQSFLHRALAGSGAALAGEHGWMMEGIGAAWHHPRLRLRTRQAHALGQAARAAALAFAGVRVETKATTVAVHWRRAPEVIASPLRLKRALRKLVPAGWRLSGGKRLWEFRPADAWGKGEVISLAARKLGAEVLFIGDDETDEEAFRHLRHSARTVKVGSGPTRARERVKGIPGVDALLRGLLSR